MRAATGSAVGSVLVLGSKRRESLVVLRSLGRAGYRIVLGRFGPRAYTEHSRYCSEAWVHPSLEPAEPEPFVHALCTFLSERPDVGFVFPVGDEEIGLLCDQRERLPATVRIAVPDREVVEICSSKARTLELIDGLGIPYPATAVAQDADELFDRIRAAGPPCIVKPDSETEEVLGRKALILRTADEIRAALDAWPKQRRAVSVQRYVEGRRRNVYFFADRGAVLASVHVQILRTDRADDTGLAVEGRSVERLPDLDRHVSALARELGYSGAGCAQFLVDERSGAVSFLEVNSRIGANCAIAYHCGLDLPHLYLELLQGKDLAPRAPIPYPIGIRYAWTDGDLHGLRQALAARDLTPPAALRWLARTIAASLRADVHITWSCEDPLPTLVLHGRWAARVLRKGARRTFRGRPRRVPTATRAGSAEGEAPPPVRARHEVSDFGIAIAANSIASAPYISRLSSAAITRRLLAKPRSIT
jgi:carbamoylphosphate synthase large subunit